MKTLTRRQKEILDFIEQYIGDKGYAPTLEAIAHRFQLSSVATVHKHLSQLQAKGFIEREWNRKQALTIVPIADEPAATVELPLLGLIAAGKPIEAIEDNQTISVPQDMVSPGKHTFVLKVTGNSMIDEQIRDGDYVIVKKAETAENGQTVVALINGDSATLKKFYRDKDRIRLQPANERMEPIFLRDTDVKIQGIVIGLLRKY